MTNDDWIEVSVYSEDEAALDATARLFGRWGYGGAVLETSPAGGSGLAKTYLAADEDGGRRRLGLEIGLALLAKAYPRLGEASFRLLHQVDWAEAWKRGYHTQHIGRRLVVVPSWEQYTPRPSEPGEPGERHEQVISLDPGMAFGTGLHETTRLCLELLEKYIDGGTSPEASSTPCRVLDVGTGSGILAVAAARLGATQVLALDTDPLAVRVAEENIRRNSVSNTVQVRWATVPGGEPAERGKSTHCGELDTSAQGDPPLLRPNEVDAPFDVVVINILANVISAMLGAGLAQWLRSNGVLIASGIIQEQAPDTATIMAQTGLDVTEEHTAGRWAAVVGRKRVDR